MKKIYSILMILAAAAGFTNCSKADLVENKETGNGEAVVYATTDAATKTTLADDYKVLWSTGDQIKFVKSGTPATTYTFTLSSGSGTTSGTFTCSDTPVDGTYTVYYPATYNDTNWPAQTYDATDISGAPMTATATVSGGSVSDISFKNEGGILRYTVKGDKTIKSINVTSSSPALNVTLNCGDGVALATGGTVFNIALPAGEYSNATLRFTATDNTVATKTASTFTVTKNKVSLATFDGLTYQASATLGTATRTGGTVNWVQLWENGPKFAEYNVGATSATDYGGYYTWGGSTDMSSGDFNTGSDPLSGDNDTAYKLWGSKWRMPTKAELEALINATNCTVERIDGSAKKYNNTTVAGLLCTGKGDYSKNSVFLPAAGRYDGGNLAEQGYSGSYWSSTPNDDSDQAYDLYFYPVDKDVVIDLRTRGFSVRAVLNETTLPEGALKGEFSVSATKTVHFSQGNLTCDISGATPDWKFYEHQYDCATGYGATLISLFTWGYDATKSIDPDGTEFVGGHNTDDESFDSTEDWGTQIGDGNTWRTLSIAEWQYLFSYDGSSSGGQNYDNDTRRDKYKYGVTVCGKANCVVLLPDGWKWEGAVGTAWQSEYNETSTTVKWSTMEAAGAVCLPAAGYRHDSTVRNVGDGGRYWSSTAHVESKAFLVSFDSSVVYPGNLDYRYFGYSVRLITECQ